MKNLLLLFWMWLVLVSCKKEEEINPEALFQKNLKGTWLVTNHSSVLYDKHNKQLAEIPKSYRWISKIEIREDSATQFIRYQGSSRDWGAEVDYEISQEDDKNMIQLSHPSLWFRKYEISELNAKTMVWTFTEVPASYWESGTAVESDHTLETIRFTKE